VISWRYHLVSIVAVFLALGLGVLAGTTVLDQGLVNSLRGRTNQLETDLGQQRAADAQLQSRLSVMNAFADQALPYLVRSRLAGAQVVVVTEGGVDGRALSEARKALDLSGAQVLTTLTIQPSLAADSPTSQRDLAALLGMAQTTSAAQLSTAAAEMLAQRLAKDPRTDLSGRPDPLGALLSQGFLTASAPGLSNSTLNQVGGRGQLVVTIGGGSAGLSPTATGFLVPFVDRLVTLGVVTGAGESLGAPVGFVPQIRAALDAGTLPLVTVDDVDLPVGGAALILGLEEAIHAGTGGDYGVKAGATGLLPLGA
jgi:hypothetical protein